ncbi:322_t:CDS:2, partial [Dentiscutata erythropus]
QHYDSDEVPEHDDYNYDDDSVADPNNSNQEPIINNIDDDKSDDNMRSDESSESDKSDQENEINEMDNSSNEPEEESTKDEINTTHPPRFKEKLPKCESCTSSDSPTKRKGQRSFVKGKKPKNLHKFSRG